jgi:hypothetical protein
MSKQRKWHYPITSGAYRSWVAMRSRCSNPNDVAYMYYGGRGITVCEEWANNFDRFWQDMGERPEGMTLDRIDNQKGYSPSNCRWVLASKQQGNQRRTKHFTFDGVTLTMTGWAERLGVPYYTIHNRLSVHKMPVEKALVPGSLNRGRPK